MGKPHCIHTVIHSFRPSRKIVKGDPEIIISFSIVMGLTQAQFAKKLGVSMNTVARWERGEHCPAKAGNACR